MEVGTGLQTGTYKAVDNEIERVYVLSCKPNTTYTISKEIGSFIRVFTSGIYPEAKVACYSNAVDNGTNVLTITTGAYQIYLGIYLQLPTETTLKAEDILSKVMVVEGDKVQEYKPFKGKQTINIYLDSPLYNGEYLDFKLGKVIRSNGIEEYLKLPEISTFEDYTKIEVETQVKPSRIDLEYMGYTLD